MEAYISKGIVYEKIDIISNIIRDPDGVFQARLNNQHQVNGRNGIPGHGPLPRDILQDGAESYDFNNPQEEQPRLELPYPQQSLPQVYGRSSSLSKTLSFLSHEPKRYRFLGDLSIYKIHWIEQVEANNFICENFNIERDVRIKKKNIIVTRDDEKKYSPYICSTKVIKKTFIPKIKSAEKNHDEAWDKVPDPAYKKSNRKEKDYYSIDEDRIFCLGCALGHKTYDRILMTAIDTSTNMLVSLSLDINCAREIKDIYIQNNKNNLYNKIEKWLYHNDLTMSCDRKKLKNRTENEYTIVPTSTIYNDLSGDIFILGHKAVLIARMHDQSYNFNGYVGSCYHNEMIKHGIANRCSINFLNKEAIFLDGITGSEYYRYDLPNNILEYYGIEDMLEL